MNLAATEAAKGYAPAQVLNALRGIGTPEGSKCLTEVGGAHLTRYRNPTGTISGLEI